MATYYRWRKSAPEYGTQETNVAGLTNIYIGNGTLYKGSGFTEDGINFKLVDQIQLYPGNATQIPKGSCVWAPSNPSVVYSAEKGWFSVGTDSSGRWKLNTTSAGAVRYSRTVSPGTSQGYVYSTSSSAYPNGGVKDGYYYDQRTTVTSPTAPTGLTYPNPITTPMVTVNWQVATSNTDYPVTGYNLYYGKNGDESTTNIVYPQNNPNTSAEVQIPSDATSIRFWVGARDSNGSVTVSEFGPWVSVYLAPTLTVPQMVMQGQQAIISWSTIEGADSYTLQRKSSADADWTQVYSGANLSYSETVGTWTSLQYRVQAVFSGTPGGWATSNSIQIVSASALVISGQDGDLGTLTNDVPYTISSDQTSPTIDVTVEVNGGEYTAFQATSGKTYKVGVLDLPTGTGSIVITASAEVSDSPVTVTRTWTYNKTAQTFPNSGSIATLTQEDKIVYPETLAEAVRTSMTPWGGNLSTALNLLKNAALFNQTKTPKYNEVTVDLSTLTQTDAQNGKIINLPVNGVMTPHRVVHIGNPDSELYDSSCDGVWVLRENIVGTGAWNTSGVNTLLNSTIMQTMAEYVGDYDTTVQSAIKTVKIPYLTSDGIVHSGANGMECKLFPPSLREVNNTMGAADGATLNYFNEGATEKRAFNFNGTPFGWWTRSITSGGENNVYIIMPNGTSATVSNPAYTGYGYLFAFILPKDFSATYYVGPNGGIHASQEYEEAGTWSDVWGNAIAIPAIKIETGSYVGTGASGSSNPNTLTFGFEPKLLMVAANNKGLDFNLYSSDIAWSASFIWFSGVTGMTMWNNPGVANLNVSVQGNKISWYSTSARSQCNEIMTTYAYLAIG